MYLDEHLVGSELVCRGDGYVLFVLERSLVAFLAGQNPLSSHFEMNIVIVRDVLEVMMSDCVGKLLDETALLSLYIAR